MDKSIECLESIQNEFNFGSLCMFLYNIKSDVPFERGTTARSEISPLLNSSAAMDGGYGLDESMLRFAEESLALLKDMTLPDFGITILMFLFARYYSHNQYAIMVSSLNGVREIEHLELYLQHYSAANVAKRALKLHNNPLNCLVRKHLGTGDAHEISPIVTSNMSTDDKYGIAANAERFVGRSALKLEEFKFITRAMSSKTLTADNFLNLIESFHIRIVESFYILTSITKDSKIINECRELSIPQMKYKFVRPVRSAVYCGDYWFVVPSGSVWFAYHQGHRTYQTYVSRDVEAVIDDELKCITSGVLVGFIYNNRIHPVVMDTPECNGNWQKTIAEFSRCGLSIVFHDNVSCAPPLHDDRLAKHLFFVRAHATTLYKYVKNK